MRKSTTVKVLFTGSIAKGMLGEESVAISLRDFETTIRGLIENLDKKSKGRLSKVLSRPNVSILLNGQDIEFLNGRKTKLHDGDRIAFIPLVAGG